MAPQATAGTPRSILFFYFGPGFLLQGEELLFGDGLGAFEGSLDDLDVAGEAGQEGHVAAPFQGRRLIDVAAVLLDAEGKRMAERPGQPLGRERHPRRLERGSQRADRGALVLHGFEVQHFFRVLHDQSQKSIGEQFHRVILRFRPLACAFYRRGDSS
jgi:hypothetical protein